MPARGSTKTLPITQNNAKFSNVQPNFKIFFVKNFTLPNLGTNLRNEKDVFRINYEKYYFFELQKLLILLLHV